MRFEPVPPSKNRRRRTSAVEPSQRDHGEAVCEHAQESADRKRVQRDRGRSSSTSYGSASQG